MYTLFQVMPSESWSMGVVRPVMEAYPHAWAVFIPFILLATFTLLNLFIGIIVNTMQMLHEAGHSQERKHIEQVVHEDTARVAQEICALGQEIATLRTTLSSQKQGNARENEI